MTTTDLLIESARLRRRSERTIASAMVGGVVFDEGDGDAQRLPVSLEISTRSLTANELLRQIEVQYTLLRNLSAEAPRRRALESLTSIETQPTAADEAALIEEMARRT